MHIFSTVNKLNVSRETFISFFTVLFVKNMALACAARARGRVARFLDFWRFSAVFCPDTGIRFFKAAPRDTRPVIRAPTPVARVPLPAARHLFAPCNSPRVIRPAFIRPAFMHRVFRITPRRDFFAVCFQQSPPRRPRPD